MSCCICSDDLTLSTVVNTHCGHQFCGECFWKWMKSKNTCPLCRKDILYNSEELKENRHMRELLDHRSTIVRDVEDSYEEKDALDREIRQKQQKSVQLSEELKKLNIDIQQGKKPYSIIKQQQELIEKTLEKIEKKQKTCKKNMIEELKYVLYAYLPSIRITKIKIKEYKKILERRQRQIDNNQDIDISEVLSDMFNNNELDELDGFVEIDAIYSYTPNYQENIISSPSWSNHYEIRNYDTPNVQLDPIFRSASSLITESYLQMSNNTSYINEYNRHLNLLR